MSLSWCFHFPLKMERTHWSHSGICLLSPLTIQLILHLHAVATSRLGKKSYIVVYMAQIAAILMDSYSKVIVIFFVILLHSCVCGGIYLRLIEYSSNCPLHSLDSSSGGGGAGECITGSLWYMLLKKEETNYAISQLSGFLLS